MQDPYELMSIAYRAAATVARSRILAEEAGERAVHLLTLAMLEGEPPDHPKAWLRVVARRSAAALLRSEWARTRPTTPEILSSQQATYQPPPTPRREFVRERIAEVLTPRQQDALQAALTCNTTRAAARCCGMPPRDFRRYLGTISQKARQALDGQQFEDRFADDASVQFQLGA